MEHYEAAKQDGSMSYLIGGGIAYIFSPVITEPRAGPTCPPVVNLLRVSPASPASNRTKIHSVCPWRSRTRRGYSSRSLALCNVGGSHPQACKHVRSCARAALTLSPAINWKGWSRATRSAGTRCFMGGTARPTAPSSRRSSSGSNVPCECIPTITAIHRCLSVSHP